MFRRGALYWNVPHPTPDSDAAHCDYGYDYSNPWKSVTLSQVDPLNCSEEFIEECYDRSQHFFETYRLANLVEEKHEHESSTGTGWRKELFRSLLVFSFKNNVILNPCQGCAYRSVETRHFPLLTGGGEVSITAANVPLSGHTPGTLMLASGWDPELGLGPGIPPPPFLPWGSPIASPIPPQALRSSQTTIRKVMPL